MSSKRKLSGPISQSRLARSRRSEQIAAYKAARIAAAIKASYKVAK